MICMASTFPTVKVKSYSRKSPKKKLFTSASTRKESQETNTVLQCSNQTSPIVETSESIEPNGNDLNVNAIAYTFSKISKPDHEM